MPYAVSVKRSAARQAEKLPRAIAARVLAKAAALANNPRPPGSIKLAGAENHWRIRVGDYRIVYVIDDAAGQIEIRIIAHRREVYRDL